MARKTRAHAHTGCSWESYRSESFMCRRGIFRFKHVFQSTNEFGIQLVNISPLTEIDIGDAVDNMRDMSQLRLCVRGII